MKKRILSILVICCMVLGLLPTTTFANNGGAKAIQLGTSGISGYDSTNSSYDYIHFGTWNNSTVKWRVLDTKTNMANAQKGDGFFLLSDALLGTGEYGGVEFDYTTPYFNDWKGSRAQDWCNDFYSRSLSITEQKAVLATSKSDALYGMYYAASDNILDGDKVFFLSAEEAENAAYGFTDDNARIANYGDSAYVWWLRSPRRMNPDSAGTVNEKGAVIGEWVGQTNAARPAFNLKPDSVLLVSAAVGGKGTADGMFKIPEYSGDEWKLTLLDDTRTFRVTETTAAGKPGGTVTLNFSGPRTGLNEYISAIIEGESGATYYGRIMKPTAADRQLSFTLPHDLASGNYKLHVFSEQYNGDYQTDYASRFQTVALTVEEAATEQFALTPGGTYYFDLSGENIPGTINDDLPDKSMHYVPFTYAGAVNAYKLTSAMATTEEYAQQYKYDHSLFIADHAVTHTVSWDDLNTKSLIFGKDYVAGGVDYTLRAPSVGSDYTGSDESQRGVPQSNECDTMLNKNSGYIQNWNKIYSWGQDAFSGDASRRAIRGFSSARHWDSDGAAGVSPSVGFRPVLEILNADTLNSDGLKVVTLDLGGGKLGGNSEDIQIIVKTGSEFTAPASDGLNRPDGDTDNYFMWLDGNGNSYEPGGSVPADVTELTVQWTAPIYAVTLNTNGGTINNGNVTEYIYGVGATLPTADDMTYTGHTFKGWYDNEGLTGDPVTAIGGTEMGNKEYWAKWEINQYTITLDTDGGSEVAPITQDYGTAITAPADPTREGYTFTGWDTAIPATMPAHNMTITAQWTVNQYTITYDLDGGTAEGNPDTYTVETDAFTLKNPTRPGYTFTGWSGTGLTGEDNLTVTIPKGSTGNRSYTAHWSLNTYSITYDLNGGTASGNPTSYTVESATITLNQPTKTGYTFTGWSGTDLTGEDNLTVTIPAGSTGDRSYTAHWSLNTYSITYDLDGGTASGNPDFYTVESSTITLNPPTRTGYTFIGWSGTDLSGSDNLTVTIPTGSIGNRSYTAHWSLNTYSITYDLDGGTAFGNPDSYTVESAAITLNEPTKAGYVFTGWSGTDLVGEDNLTVTIPAGSIGDRRYTAHWEFDPTIIAALNPTPNVDFLDVSRTDWFYYDVRYVCENGLMNGTSRNRFSPYGTATRGMLVTILYRMENEPRCFGSAAFSDVKPGAYYEKAVVWASQNNIVSGYTDGTFRPDAPVTREQLASILYRYTLYRGQDVSAGETTSLTGYGDAQAVSNYALPAMRWACGTGILQGANGKLNPSGLATRAQLAAMLHRYLTK